MGSLGARVSEQKLYAAGANIALAGAIIAMLSFFGPFLPIDLGVWPRLSPMSMLLHVSAGICAVGLILVWRADRDSVEAALAHPAVLAALFVAVWSAALAPLSDYPWLSIFGTSDIGEGTLRYAGLAVFIATAQVLGQDRARSRVLLTALAAIAAGAPLVFFAWGASLLISLDSLGIYAVIAAVSVWFLLIDRPWRWRCGAALLAMAPALAFSGNVTATVLVPILGIPAGIITGLWLYKRPGMEGRLRLAAVAGLVLAPFAGILVAAFLPEMFNVPSILSRKFLNQVLFAALEAEPRIFAIGQGWGEVELTFDRFLLAADTAMWDRSWDLQLRGTTHTHSIYLEALFGAGLPAAIGVVAIYTGVVLRARRENLPIAIFALGTVAGMGALSGQLAGTAGAEALMLGILGLRPTARLPTPALRLGARGLALCLPVIAAVFFGAGVWLFDRGNDVRLRIADVQVRGAESPHACAIHPDSGLNADMDLTLGFRKAYLPAFARDAAGEDITIDELRLVDAYVCSAQARAATSTSTHLQLALERFRNDVAFGSDTGALPKRYAASLKNWPRKLARSIVAAPDRTDIAIGYLAKNLELENWDEIMLLSRVLLEIKPDDPVALWYLGSVLVRLDDPARRAEGIIYLARAVESGITQVLEVPRDFQVQIRAQAAELAR